MIPLTGPNTYVAGAFEEKGRVQHMQQLLRDAGFVISHDWTREDATDKTDSELAAYMEECGQADYGAALDCDLFVLVVPETRDLGCGCWTEFGVALASPWPAIIVVGGAKPERNGRYLRNIFFYLPRVIHVATPEEAVTEAVDLRRGPEPVRRVLA